MIHSPEHSALCEKKNPRIFDARGAFLDHFNQLSRAWGMVSVPCSSKSHGLNVMQAFSEFARLIHEIDQAAFESKEELMHHKAPRTVSEPIVSIPVQNLLDDLFGGTAWGYRKNHPEVYDTLYEQITGRENFFDNVEVLQKMFDHHIGANIAHGTSMASVGSTQGLLEEDQRTLVELLYESGNFSVADELVRIADRIGIILWVPRIQAARLIGHTKFFLSDSKASPFEKKFWQKREEDIRRIALGIRDGYIEPPEFRDSRNEPSIFTLFAECLLHPQHANRAAMALDILVNGIFERGRKIVPVSSYVIEEALASLNDLEEEMIPYGITLNRSIHAAIEYVRDIQMALVTARKHERDKLAGNVDFQDIGGAYRITQKVQGEIQSLHNLDQKMGVGEVAEVTLSPETIQYLRKRNPTIEQVLSEIEGEESNTPPQSLTPPVAPEKKVPEKKITPLASEKAMHGYHGTQRAGQEKEDFWDRHISQDEIDLIRKMRNGGYTV